MQLESSTAPDDVHARSRHDPVVLGTICGVVSALGYTAANVCLRAVINCDPVWVSCVKSMPSVAIFGPCMVLLAIRRAKVFPTGRIFVALAATGAFGQFAGNVAFQWSLGVIGLALAAPMTLGTMIVFSAILARLVLAEPVTFRTVTSIVVLVAAIFVLSLGAGDAHRSVASTEEASWPEILAGVGAACLAGFAYALLGVAIRRAVSNQTPLSTVLVTVAVVGLAGLGALTLQRIGVTGIRATSAADWANMLGAGLCNAVAFLALTKALQLTNLVYVNALNASQVAMAAIVGILWFNEPLTFAVLVGVVLSMFGLLIMKKWRRQPIQ